MTDRELMQQALEELDAFRTGYHHPFRKLCTALRNRLAQPEPPNLACKSVQARLAAQWGYVKAEQEPVGWIDDGGMVFGKTSRPPMAQTSTPPRREWEHLTWEEIDDCFKITPDQYLSAHIYKRIFTKLKEKNA